MRVFLFLRKGKSSKAFLFLQTITPDEINRIPKIEGLTVSQNGTPSCSAHKLSIKRCAHG